MGWGLEVGSAVGALAGLNQVLVEGILRLDQALLEGTSSREDRAVVESILHKQGDFGHCQGPSGRSDLSTYSGSKVI